MADQLSFVGEQTVVGISNCFVHSDSEIFPEPHAFKPERWLGSDERGDHSLDTWLVAFSKGPRSCLGQKYVRSPSQFKPYPDASTKFGMVRTDPRYGEYIQAVRLGTRRRQVRRRHFDVIIQTVAGVDLLF